jgi:hypothetical protein
MSTDDPAARSCPGPVPGPGDLQTARISTRLGADYVLRYLQLAASLQGGDLILGVVMTAIVAANTQHLNFNPDGTPNYGGLNEPPPDAERRPISINALAASMGMPFETTRRYVNKLIDAGWCERCRNGVIVRAQALSSPESQAALMANHSNLRRLLRELDRAGVDLG